MLSKFNTLGTFIPAENDPARILFDDHYDVLVSHPETEHHIVDPYLGEVCKFNLYRYMIDKGYEKEQIFPTMVASCISSLNNFDERTKELKIPSMSLIESIRTSAV